jgi:hypothetical protein
MDVSKLKIFLYENIFSSILFVFFLTYYSLWIKYNLPFVESNTNDLNTAIKIFNYIPYVSFTLNNIISSNNTHIFLGYCLFPSLVSIMIFLIFKKILSNNIWPLSLTILSMIATENYPFVKFLTKFLQGIDFKESVNLYENFEIMGFPIPSFSIFFFCIIFYLSLRIIKLSNLKIYLITFLWLLMFHIHPVDGLIGNIYWISLITILHFQKKIKLKIKDLILLAAMHLINLFTILSQLNFEVLLIQTNQSISSYNILFYFITPIFLMSICFAFLKIDLHEFYQKFLNIYLIMIGELILIIASINGIGFELQMLENRITMFLLHYLYYIPIIYYLSKDEIFYLNSSSQKSNSGKIVILMYYVFNKYKDIYLLSFVFLMITYLFLSIKI